MNRSIAHDYLPDSFVFMENSLIPSTWKLAVLAIAFMCIAFLYFRHQFLIEETVIRGVRFGAFMAMVFAGVNTAIDPTWTLDLVDTPQNIANLGKAGTMATLVSIFVSLGRVLEHMTLSMLSRRTENRANDCYMDTKASI